jgi:GH15 family glucan-1,4-alpha-glucosidase
MTLRIEDYALIGNNATTALVGNNGSIDWLGFPRFDSPACFAALVGTKKNGHWSIAPKEEQPKVKRHYREGTLVLETEFTTPSGTAVLIDCMDARGDHQDVIRMVRGVRGTVSMQTELVLRFDYGQVVPWVSCLENEVTQAIAGPDRIVVHSPAPMHGEGLTTRAEFEVNEGQEVPFVLTWSNSFRSMPPKVEAAKAIESVTRAWQKWASKHTPTGEYADAVLRSIITLKALTDHHTGGIIAAPTTGLPEEIGGVRNWDYRYCWLRDSTFTLYALLSAGFVEEAKAWREWLIRAVAGDPAQLQIMYGIAGERRLTEFELPELMGYENSKPVRIGNAASKQLQLDIYGEVLDSLYLARKKGLGKSDVSWDLQKKMVEHLETIWPEPDDGIWEVRGGRKLFTFSKVMAWVAFDRAIRTVEEFGEEGPVDRWKRIRADIHEEVCRLGYSTDMQAFVQSFGSKELDASVLMIPLTGFLPADDPRMVSTVAAIEKHLLYDGFVARYNPKSSVDGLEGSEGAFLACSFWLADNYLLQGRREDARRMFERLLDLRNDVGLLSEEYDPKERRMLGNFPQGFSHLSLVNSAHNLTGTGHERPAHHRAQKREK